MSNMKKRTITIEFESDASNKVIEEIAEHMRWQLDSMCDGTLFMTERAEKNNKPVNKDYHSVRVRIK